jgi:hypothetical protein
MVSADPVDEPVDIPLTASADGVPAPPIPRSDNSGASIRAQTRRE